MIDKVFYPDPLVIQPTQRPTGIRPEVPPVSGVTPFARIIDEKSGIKFSQHAQERLKTRGITLNETDIKELAGALDKAAQKGGRDTLIMKGGTAFIASVANRTVITAMDQKSLSGSVITNIDSVVVV